MSEELKRMEEKHKAKIWVHSVEGGGALVGVLPNKEGIDSRHYSIPADGKTEKLLTVDTKTIGSRSRSGNITTLSDGSQIINPPPSRPFGHHDQASTWNSKEGGSRKLTLDSNPSAETLSKLDGALNAEQEGFFSKMKKTLTPKF
jgi:hypothetical protein